MNRGRNDSTAKRTIVGQASACDSLMKSFDNQWIFEAFEDHPSFFTKRMFGGLAAYAFGRMMMILVEPTKTGRWKWHGVLVCTEHAHRPAIVEEFPALASHDILKKWLYIDSRDEDFEPTMEGVAKAIARDDGRFGIHPRPRKESKSARSSPKKRLL
jgi:hypothetical protein